MNRKPYPSDLTDDQWQELALASSRISFARFRSSKLVLLLLPQPTRSPVQGPKHFRLMRLGCNLASLPKRGHRLIILLTVPRI